ncbi:ParB/RepB/Spo0J family partition protein [Azospirillum sp.]|uniref:ParB/RepB/Spo0J family partition protein n=1 Tax=Azospirillum sp. TaxID=34012 RepID=UPI002D45BE79|nr:ParB/RepB/Spo0J family partition protein [Azospirillum sp.]HYD70319.1 ParB/RepB/Spo0J family partition protein [Azospirillum sp.]
MSRKLERTSTQIFQKAAQRGGDALFGLSADFPRLIEVDIARVRRNPDQPRKRFDEDSLHELAQSIERHGLKQPVLVQEADDGAYRLVAGERRLRACTLLGRKTIFAIVTEGDPDELALIENIQRVDLDAVEQAGAFARLIERHGYTHEALGRVIGRSQADVTRTLSLLRLPDEIRAEYEAQFRGVPKSVLVEVASVDDPDLQRRLWNAVKDGGTVKALREAKRAGGVAGKPAPAPVVRLVAAAQRIARDFAAIDERSLRDQRARIDAAQRAELERLHRLLGELLG